MNNGYLRNGKQKPNEDDIFKCRSGAVLAPLSGRRVNHIVKRQIRSLAVERKITLFFGSHSMAKLAAIYLTVIFTCKMIGCSAI